MLYLHLHGIIKEGLLILKFDSADYFLTIHHIHNTIFGFWHYNALPCNSSQFFHALQQALRYKINTLAKDLVLFAG